MSARDRSSRVGVGVVGGSGYIGGELLRYLLAHPRVELRWATANSQAGQPVGSVLPNLLGFSDLVFTRLEDVRGRLDEVRAVFVCLPHNHSQEVVPSLHASAPGLAIIDMGGDFRTNDSAGYQRFYGREHAAPELLSSFVYGFTEFRRKEVAATRLVANPGCFATTLDVALAPLAKHDLLRGDVFATAITGSSGAGNKPLPTTHHPERATNVRAYKVLGHQHVLEVEAFLRTLTRESFRLRFVPQSGPYVRGIFATVFTPSVGLPRLTEIFHEAYDAEALIDVVEGSPELRWVQGTPRTVVGVAGSDGDGVVFCVTDNLGKGAAGQALQNFNLMLDFPETEGLLLPGGFV